MYTPVNTTLPSMPYKTTRVAHVYNYEIVSLHGVGMSSGLHDKCSCGRYKESYLEKCLQCRMEIVQSKAEYFTTDPRQRDRERSQEKTTLSRTPLKMKKKQNTPNTSSTKRSCEYMGCKNTASKGKAYCGLHYLEEVRWDPNLCKGCKVRINPRKEYCKSCRRDRERSHVKTTLPQAPFRKKVKQNTPNISSSKRSCEYAGCKNTTSKGKMYCGLHYLEGVERNGGGNHPRASKSPVETSTSSHGNCSKCGREILSNHGVAKAAKLATYTPASGWIGMTIGMALGGLPGLFLGGLMGGTAGYQKALEDKQICFDCKFK